MDESDSKSDAAEETGVKTATDTLSDSTVTRPVESVDKEDDDYFVSAPPLDVERLAFAIGGVSLGSSSRGDPAGSASAVSASDSSTSAGRYNPSLLRELKIDPAMVPCIERKDDRVLPMKHESKKQSKRNLPLIRKIKMDRGMWSSYIRAPVLVSLMKDPSVSLAIIDVRQPLTDFKGGHIQGANNVPFESMMDSLPGLINEFHSHHSVVFHCMYSQVRGPASCELYCLMVRAICEGFDKFGSDRWMDILKYDDDLKQGPFARLFSEREKPLRMPWESEDSSASEEEEEEFTPELLVDLSKLTVEVSEQLCEELLLQNVHILDKGFRGFLNAYVHDEETTAEGKPLIADFDASFWEEKSFVSGRKELYHCNDW